VAAAAVGEVQLRLVLRDLVVLDIIFAEVHELEVGKGALFPLAGAAIAGAEVPVTVLRHLR
jgi:hypothetical protein